MTTIPKPSRPRSGLSLTRSGWAAEYTEDGKRRRKSLGTKDLDEAIQRRDEFYVGLMAAGAVTAGDPTLAAAKRRDCDPDDPARFIHRSRRPYRVTIGGTVIGHYDTREEAMKARNEHLNQQTQ